MKRIQKLFPETKYISHKEIDGKLLISLESTQKTNACPLCGSVSSKVHSYYQRKFSDLPIDEFQTEIYLTCKKFFCINKECKRKTFSENFDFIKPSEAKTNRLINEILNIYQNHSSRKASLLLGKMGISACKATVCNLKNKQ